MRSNLKVQDTKKYKTNKKCRLIFLNFSFFINKNTFSTKIYKFFSLSKSYFFYPKSFFLWIWELFNINVILHFCLERFFDILILSYTCFPWHPFEFFESLVKFINLSLYIYLYYFNIMVYTKKVCCKICLCSGFSLIS